MPAWEDCGCAAAAAAAGAPGEFDQHISLLAVVALRRRRWVALSAAFDPCAARGGAVALAGRDGRLSVPPSFPHSVWARAFYAVLELPAAVLACCRNGLDLGVLPPVTIFAMVSGGILASENHP